MDDKRNQNGSSGMRLITVIFIFMGLMILSSFVRVFLGSSGDFLAVVAFLTFGVGLVSVVIGEKVKRSDGGARDRRSGTRQPPRSMPDRPVPKSPGFDPYAKDHQHITGTWMSTEKRLEQLSVMKGAGLITEEEYREKRREIMEERH